jgi:hypothetical protein
MSIALRNYQAEICREIDRLDHPLVPLPTGAGKTVIASAIIRTATDRRQRCMFVAHRRELVQQASEKLLANDVNHAILMAAESSAYPPKRKSEADKSRPHPFAIELDAIEPDDLRAMVEFTIEQYLPTDELRILQAAEESEREVIAGLVAGIAGAHPGALDREAAP